CPSRCVGLWLTISIGLQRLAQFTEAEAVEQPVKLAARRSQVEIMAEARAEAAGQARLLGVQLPGMNVKEERTVLAAVNPLQASRRPAYGIKPEIAAARDRHIQPTQPHYGRRKLPQTPGDAVRQALGVRDAIAVMPDRVDA